VRARLRARVDSARVDADDVTPEVISSLVGALERNQAAHGSNAYVTGLARRSLATAYRRRRAGTDLTDATALAADDTRAHGARYGPEHPVTLDARSLLAVSLLAQAESAPAERERRDLATKALSEITTVRAAQDRRRGVASPDSVASHRREARALLLLGEVSKARASMDFARRLESAAQEA
jgi:DNA-directed RNA polymerase specialized sigma24 family protein